MEKTSWAHSNINPRDKKKVGAYCNTFELKKANLFCRLNYKNYKKKPAKIKIQTPIKRLWNQNTPLTVWGKSIENRENQ